MRELKEIALELLGKYKDSETHVIWEYSDSIDKDLKGLEEECKWYREEIEAADVSKIKKGKWIYDNEKRICPFCKDFIVTGRKIVKYCWNCGAELVEE